MTEFRVVSEFEPMGDQPQAIEAIADSILQGNRAQTLMGVTGSGKTFTMANIIQQLNRPTLIIAHNKTLAAQLHGEFKEFFPDNAVEYFVSYYDYYQPEAYVASTDTYIEKDSDINDEIEKLRHSATAALSERRDVIIVASVSCIYGLGSPIDYENQVISLRPGMEKDRQELLRKLVDIQYTRNDTAFERGDFRVEGDTIDVHPAGSENAVRIELFGDEIESIKEINPLTGEIIGLQQPCSDLSGLPLRDEPGEHRESDGDDQRGAGGKDPVVQGPRQAHRSAADRAADQVRCGDAPGDRHLQGHRELFTSYHGPSAREQTVYADRLYPG